MLERAQGTACISLRGRRGSQEHRAGKAWKMAPSVARVAGIASAACMRVSTRPGILFRAERPDQIFCFGQSGIMGRVQGYVIPY